MEKKKSGKNNWEEFQNADLGNKKMMFVKYLMKKGVPLMQARMICHRKFYHGDTFEK